MRLARLILILSVSGLAACGYTVKQDQLSLGPVAADKKDAVQKVYIPVVDNLTTRTGMEGTLTNSLREALAGAQGIQVVADESQADFFLLGTLTKYVRAFGPNPTTGNIGTEQGGGLMANESTSKNINVTLVMDVRLVQRVKESDKLRRLLWNRTFSQGGTYDASLRFTEREGASSVANINNSREQIQVKALADTLAQQVVDQATQDF
ncbi:MAG: hypothetical protein JST16_13850 [Bdellovibrionales bacterium]|nr:hypothetical protein [Bdellovibrionales bacterium]